MKSPSWLKTLFARLTGRPRCRPIRRSVCLRLEALEDRIAPAVFTVTNVLDDGVAGSFRWAINEANSTAGADEIRFAIGTGVQTIAPQSALPTITDSVVIDGTTQPGFAGTPIIELRGTSAGAGATGLTITASNSVVRGLVVNGFGGSGIVISGPGASNNIVSGNYIGTDVSGRGSIAGNGAWFKGEGDTKDALGGPSGAFVGTPAFAPGMVGQGFHFTGGNYVEIPASAALRPATPTIEAWVKPDFNGRGSQNDADFIYYAGSFQFAVNMDPNNVFFQAPGPVPLGTLTFYTTFGAESHQIFSSTPIPNDGQFHHVAASYDGSWMRIFLDGVEVANRAVSGTVQNAPVAGNPVTIGSQGNSRFARAVIDEVGVYNRALSAAEIQLIHGRGSVGRSGAVGNIADGIRIQSGATGNTIGGTTAAARNIISGNSQSGVIVYVANDNAILGNYIGTNAAGNGAVPNGYGIRLLDHANRTTIGGSTPGSGNVISGNTHHGISAGFEPNTGPDATVIRGNLIGTNARGTAALGNGENGISLAGWVTNTVVGGTTPAERNVVSANGRNGIEGGTGTVVTGNYVGTDVTGLVGIGNRGIGIRAYTVGGLTPVVGTGAGNVVSGNAEGINGNIIQGNIVGLGADGVTRIGNRSGISGILIGGTAAGARNLVGNNTTFDIAIGSNSVVQGNYVGTDITGKISTQNPVHLQDNIGIFISGSNNLIGGPAVGAGNLISGHFLGIKLDDSNGPNQSGNVIQGNRIGTDVTGTAAIGNVGGVVVIGDVRGTLIGGSGPGQGNVISGNKLNGIGVLAFYDRVPDGTVIRGNRIGTTADGMAALGNTEYGVNISTSRNTTVGGTNVADRNVISGNGRFGVFTNDESWGANIVIESLTLQGNFIGTNAAGTAALPNGAGILLVNKNITVGGSAPGAGNVISGNTGAGIDVGDPYYTIPFATNNAITGNLIGTDASGTQPLGNGTGIRIVKANGTAVSGNVIRWNAGNGITALPGGYNLYSQFSYNLGNQFRGNTISDNGGLGIDLGNNGVTVNDAQDTDVGANGLQNYPALTAAQGGSTTTVQGSLNSTPNTTFWLDFYASATADPSGHGEGKRYLGSFPVTTDGSGNWTFTTTPLGATSAGEVITATATGPDGTSEFSQVLTDVVYNQPPTANAGGPYTVAEGSSITLNGSGSSDPDQSAGTLTYQWDFDNDGQFDDATGVNPTFSAAGLDGYPGAALPVRLRVTDSAGATGINNATVNITNANPIPLITSISAVRVEGTVINVVGSATDPAGSKDTLTFAWAVYKDGSATAFVTGGNSTSFNFTPTDNGSYKIVLTVSDEDGGSASIDQTIAVANVAPTTGVVTGPLDPVAVNAVVNVGGGFTDPGAADTHSATWNWGDGTTSTGAVSETNGSGTATGRHAYTAAGVYTVILTVADDDTGSSSSTFQYVVVYDPSAGFVTGGGWINSPAGAYAADPSLTGRANFGFISRYQRGTTVPDGNTQFQFQTANFNFRSTSYDWMVVAGSRAQYKGSGTVNGSGNYGFLLTATDGQLPGGGGVDKFRIKVWNKATGLVIYDNQMGAEDDAAPVTTLGSGSIQIHSGGSPLLAASEAAVATSSKSLATGAVKPILAEALRRWEAAGVDTSSLGSIQIRIADLPGAMVGMVSGNTIWLDANAAGWGWFVDSTPGDDSEFSTDGDQGEQGRIDLLTVLMHEIGHRLGHEHEADGVMGETLATGTRSLISSHTAPTDALASLYSIDVSSTDAWHGARSKLNR